MNNRKKPKENISLFHTLTPLLFLTTLFYCCILSYAEQRRYQVLEKKMTQIRVALPALKPEMSQESVDLAMAIFSIQKNAHTSAPILAKDLELRGLTVGESFSATRQVYIGKMAFESWGLLGSTLAHEIEIHSNQSFTKIEFINYLDNLKFYSKYLFAKDFANEKNNFVTKISYGSYRAEKEAYEYEINSKTRFNLTNSEVYGIKYTLEHGLD